MGSTMEDGIGANQRGPGDALLAAQIEPKVAPPHCATPRNGKGFIMQESAGTGVERDLQQGLEEWGD